MQLAPLQLGQRHNHRNRSAKLMTSDEIEQILRIQWAATHPMVGLYSC
jgi:hypothetical protein